MAKVPFTPDGFDDLQTTLYALTNAELEVEANAVFTDYISWVDDHVVLNAAQLAYLNALDPVFITQLASRASIAFLNRLPLNLVLPPDYDPTAIPSVGKWFLDGSTIAVSNSPGQTVTATGELIYEIQFE
ncbi:hypothetical protein [Sphingobacterium multivorum]|uniref:hypothetical protein n=1 Tax=Sphingobacterium multivorum TaxID=28454 RepID=UPI0028A595B6|nr:hypothetical protein [Sphingobacterium multivorum]